MRVIWLGLFVAGTLAAAGCGGGNTRGKNKDYDVPVSTAKP